MMIEMRPKVGDKVRVKATKVRGVVESLDGERILLRLESGQPACVESSGITNYSLAARKAWKNMPSRGVGRPKGTTTTDRISVTLRIDRKLWQQFKEAEGRGLIRDRTAIINDWIAEKLRELNS